MIEAVFENEAKFWSFQSLDLYKSERWFAFNRLGINRRQSECVGVFYYEWCYYDCVLGCLVSANGGGRWATSVNSESASFENSSPSGNPNMNQRKNKTQNQYFDPPEKHD